jgi:hypothetical protein
MADEMIDEMTDLGRLPDIHLVMDFALLSTALMTDPRMTGVPRVSAVPEITALEHIRSSCSGAPGSTGVATLMNYDWRRYTGLENALAR